MGLYLNPKDGESNKAFLEREGTLIPHESMLTWEGVPDDSLPVVLIDNGHFSVGAICYSRKEYADALDPFDDRKRTVFLVKVAKLAEVIDARFRAWLDRAKREFIPTPA